MTCIHMISVHSELSKGSGTTLKTALNDKMRIICMHQPNMGHQLAKSSHSNIATQWTNQYLLDKNGDGSITTCSGMTYRVLVASQNYSLVNRQSDLPLHSTEFTQLQLLLDTYETTPICSPPLLARGAKRPRTAMPAQPGRQRRAASG